MACETEAEAHYLVAVLNSDVLADEIVKLQSIGLFGARHIDTLPWRFAIRRYDSGDAVTVRLSDLGIRAAEVAADVDVPEDAGFSAVRTSIRGALNESGVTDKINATVTELLGLTS